MNLQILNIDVSVRCAMCINIFQGFIALQFADILCVLIHTHAGPSNQIKSKNGLLQQKFWFQEERWSDKSTGVFSR